MKYDGMTKFKLDKYLSRSHSKKKFFKAFFGSYLDTKKKFFL